MRDQKPTENRIRIRKKIIPDRHRCLCRNSDVFLSTFQKYCTYYTTTVLPPPPLPPPSHGDERLRQWRGHIMEGNGYLTSRNPLICGSLLLCILLIHPALMAKFVSPGALYTLANFWLQNHRSGRVKI